jgi:type III secretion protein Q
MGQVSAYPWAGLERLSRATVREMTRARSAIGGIRAENIARALGELTSSEVVIVTRNLRAGMPPGDDAIPLEVGDHRVAVGVDPALASLLLSRVLGRPAGIDGGGALDPSLRGALGALVAEAARRGGGSDPIRVARESSREPSLCLDATVLVDGTPFAARVWVKPGGQPARFEAPALAALGDLPISIPLVVGVALADPAELASLAVGDAWLAGEGFFIDRSLQGRAVLAAPSHEAGCEVSLAPDGSLVVGQTPVLLESEEEMSSKPGSIEEAALDAPIVVRVELGTVSMTAREWAALAPGDVIETGRRVSEPVALRVGGREVARGELCDIEGELGVRIREIVGGEQT